MSDRTDNFELLKKLYQIVTPQGLLGRYKLDKFTDQKVNIDAAGDVLAAFVNSVDSSGSGLLLYDELRKKIDDAKSKAKSEVVQQINTYVNLYDKFPSSVSMETILGSQNVANSDTALRVISLTSPTLGLSLRDVNRTGIFMNAVPSLELSRCTPLLEVNFELAFPAESPDKSGDSRFAAGLSARSPTLLRYLNGVEGNYGSADVLMAKGSLKKVDLSSRTNNSSLKQSWKDSASITSGMELFTSPQTLVSPDSTLSTRQVPVLDRFSALMSIESFEITATPSGGAMSYKTAKLNIVLHDRSRMHEIAALIKPDAYSRTTVSISYGWSHPDTNGESPIGELINQMVVRDEKYNIVNSSFSFGGGGGAKITLSLATKGGSELGIIRIADSEQFSKLDVKLQELADAIRENRDKIPGLSQADFNTKDVRVYQIIDAAANNGELIDNYTTKDAANITKFLKELQSSKSNKNDPSKMKALQELLQKMSDFLDTKKKKSDVFDPKNKGRIPLIDNVLGEKFKTMIGHTPDGKFAAAPDPYLDETARYWSDAEKEEVKKIKSGKSNKPRTFVSLAKLMLFYVGIPLQSVGSFDEVQFVYYPFNIEAGFAKETSLASFPVDIAYFRDVLADHAKRKGNANLTVREFMQLLYSSIIQDVRNQAYGLREFYANRTPGKTDEEPVLNKNATIKNVTDKLNGVFRKPVVEMQIECRGGRPTAHGDTSADKRLSRVVRVHVYDKLSSAYEPTLKVLEAQQGLQAFEKDQTSSAIFSNLSDIADQIGLSLKDQQFKSYDDLKRFISQVVPVLNYGANNSGIIAATLQTMQNSDLATVNMQRSMGPQYNSEPNGSSVSAIPLRVQPSQLDLTLIGCPLLNLAQQYFVDFNTGTTVDDLYVLTHLSHRIAAGKFESTAKLTPMNAYGAYENVADKVRKLKTQIDGMLKSKG